MCCEKLKRHMPGARVSRVCSLFVFKIPVWVCGCVAVWPPGGRAPAGVWVAGRFSAVLVGKAAAAPLSLR